jgi:hypothetical protein
LHTVLLVFNFVRGPGKNEGKEARTDAKSRGFPVINERLILQF